MARQVLIVDDEPSIRRTLREFLRDEGHEVLAAAAAAQAIELLSQRPIEIVVSDVLMPQLDGVELLEAIRRFSPRVKVILITGHPTVDSAIGAVRSAGGDYLGKPISGDAICRAVARAARMLDLEEEARRHRDRLESLVSSRAVAMEEASFRALADNTPSAVLRFDRRGRCLFANRAVERVLGIAPSQLVGSAAAGLGEKLGEAVGQGVAEVLGRGDSWRGAMALPDGRRADWLFFPEWGEGGVAAVGALVAAGRRAGEADAADPEESGQEPA